MEPPKKPSETLSQLAPPSLVFHTPPPGRARKPDLRDLLARGTQAHCPTGIAVVLYSTGGGSMPTAFHIASAAAVWYMICEILPWRNSGRKFALRNSEHGSPGQEE